MNADFLYAKIMEFLEEHGAFVDSYDGKRKIYKPKDPSLIVNVIIDHGGLFQPTKGRTKKEEIDLPIHGIITPRADVFTFLMGGTALSPSSCIIAVFPSTCSTAVKAAVPIRSMW